MAHFSIQVVDGEGLRKSFTIPTLDTVTVANAATYAGALVTAYHAVSGCRITSIEFCVGIDIGAPPTLGVSGSRVDAGATLSFLTEAGRRFSHYVPGFVTDFMQDGIVNIANATVQAYTDLLVDGASGVLPTDINGLDLTDIVRGIQTTRR